MYTSLETLQIRDCFETSYLRHVYKCMNAAVTSHLTFVTFYVKRCRLTFSVHNTVLWYPRRFFLPDKFLFSFAAYVRRYIAWAMKVDVIMLTDFLTVENNRGINMYYSYQICYCWHSHLGEKKQMTNSVNNREFLNKDEVRERRGLREGIARAGSIRRVLASIQCQWQW